MFSKTRRAGCSGISFVPCNISKYIVMHRTCAIDVAVNDNTRETTFNRESGVKLSEPVGSGVALG